MNDTPLRPGSLNDTASAQEQSPSYAHHGLNLDRQPRAMDNANANATAPQERTESPAAEQQGWEQMMESSPSTMSPGTVRVAVKEMLETAIYILLVFVIVRSLVQNFKIEGSSMEPSLHSGQYILVNKLIYFHFDLHAPLRLMPGYDELDAKVVYPLRLPERGDIVVFEYPRDPTKDFIKRVIALPGETVTIEEGAVYVDDQRLDEPYLRGAQTYCSSQSECSQGPVVVPPDSIFVMGDNRANSSDSREWEALPLDRVIGQAWLLYYPVDDWGVIPDASYAFEE